MFSLVCLTLAVLLLGSQYVEGEYNYDEILHKSIFFYEAQRSGYLPSTNRIPWRGNSALGDKGFNNEDLTGGWYDAGDSIKFGLPMAMATTALAWGGIEFREAYKDAGEFENLLDCLRWPLDYFMKCHVSTNHFYGQVGDATLDHSYWGRPEQMKMRRPAWLLSPSAPGSDLAGETAAALAASYILFKDSDRDYANRLLDNARRLFNFAYSYRGKYSDSISNARPYYLSSGYNDELAWAAAWLYRATAETNYLNKALEFANQHDVAWAYDWDSKIVAYQLLLTSLGQTSFKAGVERFLRNWFPGGNVRYTPKGLAWRLKWGANRYAGNAAFIALVAAKYNILPTESVDFARSQIHYMLGDSGRSFVVGFGNNPPQRPHHRAASCKDRPAPCSWKDFNLPTPNPQTLYGALVAGPDENDNYVDSRKDYVQNEVACDYNAGFQSAVAGLKSMRKKTDCNCRCRKK